MRRIKVKLSRSMNEGDCYEEVTNWIIFDYNNVKPSL